MPALPDGDYDVFVVDARSDDEVTLHLELAVVSGEAKGEVVLLRGPAAGRDPIGLLGLPGVLRVIDGVPRFQLDGGA